MTAASAATGVSGSIETLRAKLDGALIQRAAEFPARGDGYHQSQQLTDELFAVLKGNLSSVSPLETSETGTARVTPASPVFICGPMKSGTTLLLSLLDNHPNLLAMPGDSHYADRWWNDSAEPREPLLREWFGRMINPTGQDPFWFLGGELANYERFLKYLADLLANRQASSFLCAAAAVQQVSGTADRRLVEKTPGNEMHVDRILVRHPDARFLQVVRDPVANLASLARLSRVRSQERNEQIDILGQAINVRRQLRQARHNIRKHTDRVLVVRFEELTSNPQQTMAEVATFLGIDFADSLLVPSQAGVPTRANSMTPSRRQSKGRILDHGTDRVSTDVFTGQEVQDIAAVLGREVSRWGYSLDGLSLPAPVALLAKHPFRYVIKPRLVALRDRFLSTRKIR